jgi:hypothetical protein
MRTYGRISKILTKGYCEFCGFNAHASQLEKQGADIQTKVEELQMLNQSLRNRDKLKDDAIMQLSDQLMALSTRLREIERRQKLS